MADSGANIFGILALLAEGIFFGVLNELQNLPRNPEGHNPKYWRKHPKAIPQKESSSSPSKPSQFRDGLNFLFDKIWTWPGVLVIFTFLLGAAVSAAYSRDFVAASIFCFLAFLLLAIKAIWNEDVQSHASKRPIIAMIVVGIVGSFAVSQLLEWRVFARLNQQEQLRQSFLIKAFTVDWAIHIPPSVDLEGFHDPFTALTRLLCRPLDDGVLSIVLIPADSAPFGQPKLLMEVVVKHPAAGSDRCAITTDLGMTDENGERHVSRDTGFYLAMTGYDKKRRLLKLRSTVTRYYLQEMKMPQVVLSDFGALIPEVLYADEQNQLGLITYTGPEVGNVMQENLPPQVDIVVQPDPPEDDLDSRWSIVAVGHPPVWSMSRSELEMKYLRKK